MEDWEVVGFFYTDHETPNEIRLPQCVANLGSRIFLRTGMGMG